MSGINKGVKISRSIIEKADEIAEKYGIAKASVRNLAMAFGLAELENDLEEFGLDKYYFDRKMRKLGFTRSDTFLWLAWGSRKKPEDGEAKGGEKRSERAKGDPEV